MIDLGRIFDRSAEKKAEAWLRLAQLLIEAVREHAIEGDSADYKRFREDMKALQDRLSHATPAAEVLVLAGSAVKQLEDYNRGAMRFLSARAAQVQYMVGMLTRTIGDTASLDRDSLARLKRIERRLEKASAIEDVLAVKAHMAECLENLRAESKAREAQIERLANSISEPADELPADPGDELDLQAGDPANGPDDPPVADLDPLTGLSRRQAAVKCLTNAFHHGQPRMVAALRLKQLAAVNNRYGNEVGDALLLAVRARLQPVLGAGDELFRWSGNAFLAALERPGDVNLVTWELNRAIPKHAKESFPFKSRSLMLNLGVESAVFRVAEFPRAADLEAAIDQFLGLQLEGQAEGIEC